MKLVVVGVIACALVLPAGPAAAERVPTLGVVSGAAVTIGTQDGSGFDEMVDGDLMAGWVVAWDVRPATPPAIVRLGFVPVVTGLMIGGDAMLLGEGRLSAKFGGNPDRAGGLTWDSWIGVRAGASTGADSPVIGFGAGMMFGTARLHAGFSLSDVWWKQAPQPCGCLARDGGELSAPSFWVLQGQLALILAGAL